MSCRSRLERSGSAGFLEAPAILVGEESDAAEVVIIIVVPGAGDGHRGSDTLRSPAALPRDGDGKLAVTFR